jgi:hypothetical protein
LARTARELLIIIAAGWRIPTTLGISLGRALMIGIVVGSVLVSTKGKGKRRRRGVGYLEWLD